MESISIHVSKVLTGEGLLLQENCTIDIENGIIKEITPDSACSDTDKSYHNYIAVPGFINSHLHSGDSIAKDKAYGLSLDETVGQNGVKHQWLANNQSRIQLAIENTIEELVASGTSAAIETREGGLKGLEAALNARKSSNYQLKIHGRPGKGLINAEKVINTCDGFGLNATTVYEDDELLKLAEIGKKTGKKTIIHCMETADETALSKQKHGKTDLERALDLL